MTRTDFEAVNGVGTTVATFGNLDMALNYVEANQGWMPGLHVQKVVTRTYRTVVSPEAASQRIEAIGGRVG